VPGGVELWTRWTREAVVVEPYGESMAAVFKSAAMREGFMIFVNCEAAQATG